MTAPKSELSRLQQIDERREAIEHPEPIAEVSRRKRGFKEVSSSFNSQTHVKIILTKETATQLVDYGRNGKYHCDNKTFDEIIKALLKSR